MKLRLHIFFSNIVKNLETLEHQCDDNLQVDYQVIQSCKQ